MAATVSDHTRLVLSASQNGRSSGSGFNLHMMPPVLLGLAAPMMVIGLLDPSGLRHGRLVVLALLVSLLVLATLLFALSLFWPGDTIAVVFHLKDRKVEFVQSGVLANTSVEVYFDEIATIGVASRFDRDGYPFAQAEIGLRDGQRVPLPMGTTPEMIAAVRRALGL